MALIRWLCSFLVCLLMWFCCLGISPAIALPDAPSSVDTPQLYDAIPDWSTLSLDDLGVVSTAGSVPQLKRSWAAGSAISEVLNLGDLADSLAPQKFSLDQISQLSGVNLNQVSLRSFPLVNAQSIGTLAEVIPWLTEFKINDIEPIKTLFLQQNLSESLLDLPLGQVLSQNSTLSNLTLSQLPSDLLGELNVLDIPNVGIPAIEELSGWETQAVSKVPGLNSVPLASFPSPIPTIGSIVARIDFVYGPSENKRFNTISGSYEVGFSARCPDDGILTEPEDSPVKPAKCAYIELDDLENEGAKAQGSFEGKQWISGKYQEVKGGSGALANTPGVGYDPGYEPTGRHPFGPLFKQVIWEPDETTDQTSSYLFFRFCVPDLGCTPYNQLGVPFITYPVNSLIFVGADEGMGSGESGGDVSSSGAIGQSGSAPPIAVSANEVPCVQGVGSSNLANAIAAIESQGSGDYAAVGVYTCADACGRAIGRYQTMNYLESVRAAVGSRSGGIAWLDSIRDGHVPTNEEIMRFYPPEMQEQVFKSETTKLQQLAAQETDPTTGQPFTGGRLIERTAQMWFAGPGSPIDGSGSDANRALSIKDYGVRARQNYEAAAKGIQPQNCTKTAQSNITGNTGSGEAGKASGTLIDPAPGATSQHNYGEDRGDHIHQGVDLSGEMGDPILAADGGTVILEKNDPGGYGNFIVVDHGNGRLTLYGHLDQFRARQGESVKKGQRIGDMGNTGRSTGPHLHFEVIEGATSGNAYSGAAVNPEPYLKP
jgi:murein DD-endopeptidase MepM/ murein hydrolase activator NlpD